MIKPNGALTSLVKIAIIANFTSYVTKRGAFPLANSKQALKRARQSEKHRVSNRWQVSRMNTHIKRVLTAIGTKDVNAAKTEYQTAISLIDRLVHKGLVHKNKAARHKSRLNKHILEIAKA